MISTPTVLILGAGASQPYGFPLGRELRDQVCGISDFNQYLLDNHDFKGLQEFIDQLKHSAHTSVDEFLENRPEFLELGKAVMSVVLIPYERHKRLFPPRAPGEHWYEFLANRMEVGSDRFEENQLSVLTFNYDRSFEHYLFTVLKYNNGGREDEAYELLNSVSIVHLYGSLGRYPTGSLENGREYRPDLSPDDVTLAARSIRVVNEVEDQFPDHQEVLELLNSANRIYFLGFGYHPMNVRRLEIFNSPWSDERRQRQSVKGTARGIPEKDWAVIRESMFNLNIGNHYDPYTVPRFLRQVAELD